MTTEMDGWGVIEQALDAWNESDHPRDAGKFVSKGSGGGGAEEEKKTVRRPTLSKFFLRKGTTRADENKKWDVWGKHGVSSSVHTKGGAFVKMPRSEFKNFKKEMRTAGLGHLIDE